MSVFVLAGSIGFSAYVENGSRKVQILQIQQELRDRYLNYKPILDSLDARNYPDIRKSYTTEERYQLSRYWSEIQFNEFMVIKKFGRGELEDEWAPVYGVWAANALEEFQVLREEFCFFIKNEKAYMGGYGDEFEEAIRQAFKDLKKNESINCDALLLSRSKNTSNKVL